MKKKTISFKGLDEDGQILHGKLEHIGDTFYIDRVRIRPDTIVMCAKNRGGSRAGSLRRSKTTHIRKEYRNWYKFVSIDHMNSKELLCQSCESYESSSPCNDSRGCIGEQLSKYNGIWVIIGRL